MKTHKGFTLVELMIVIVVIGILAAIGYPAYTQHVIKAKRSAAEGFMTAVANRQEQYMLDARQYASGASALTTLGIATPTEVAQNYNISVIADNTATPPSYTITAAPFGVQQANDTQCANLTLDHTGAKGVSGSGPATACW